MPGFGDIVVDEANSQIFISPGPDGSKILVRDLNGAPTGSIASQPGATGMVLDGTKLYVALCEQSAISVINTVTRAENERISLGTTELAGTCDITIAGGRLWVPDSDQHARLTSVTIAAPHTVVTNALGTTISNPIFPTITTPTSALIVGTEGISPGTWRTFNVGAHPATQATSAQSGSNLQDGAVTANGSHLVTASGSPYYGARLALPALTPAGTYTTDAYPTGTAVSPDGAWLAIARSSGDRDVYVFASGSPTPVRSFDLGSYSGNDIEPLSRGVRFNSSVGKLYVIGSESPYNDYVALSVFDSPTSGAPLPAAPSVAPAPSNAAAVASSTNFPLTGTTNATSLVVDAANSRLYIAPGRSGSAIQVRNLDGSAAGTIPDTPGATSMVLDNGKLYVTLCGWNAIEVINATTLAKIERIDLGTNVLGGLCSLGLAGGRLIYTEGDDWVRGSSVTVATPHVFATNIFAQSLSDPVFTSSPSDPSRLFAAETGISTTEVGAYTVNASSVTKVASRDISGFSDHVGVTATGSHTAVSLHELRASDLSIATTYSGYPRTTMAYSGDGNWVAGLRTNSGSEGEVEVYARGDNRARRSFDLVTGSGDVFAGTAAFSPTSDKLYAVAAPSWSTPVPALHVINAPTAALPDHPANSVAPSVSGDAPRGSMLTCASGTWSGTPTYAYSWQRDGSSISGATAATYTTVANDVGKTVRCVVRATNGGGSVSALPSNSVTVVPPPTPPSNTVLPAITGTANEGSTLTCGSGAWNGAPTYGYQWRRNSSPISGATSTTLVVSAADFTATLSCVVTGTNAGGSASATSAGVLVNPPAPSNTSLPLLSGMGTEGSTLTCGTGVWNWAVSYGYQWRRNGSPISGATTATRVVSGSDVGTTLTCSVTATNTGGSASATSLGITVVVPPTNEPVNLTLPTITGTPVAGARLTCLPGSWTRSPAYDFVWLQDGSPILFATATTYDVDPADVGTELTCEVTATSAGESTTVSSAATVIGVRPLNVTLPTVAGAATLGATLTCSPGTWSINVTYNYVWTRNGVAQPARTSSYVVTSADAGTNLRCAVQGRSDYGSTTATSAGIDIPAAALPVIPPPTVIRETPRVPVAPTPTLPGPDADEDEDAPVVTLTAGKQTIAGVLRSGLAVKAGCNETCTSIVTVEVSAATAKRLKLKSRVLTANVSSRSTGRALNTLSLRIPRAVRTKIAAARSVTVTIRVVATDAAGNATTKTKRIVLGR